MPMSTPARPRTRTLLISALHAALLAVSAWITVPVGTVPVTAQTLTLAVIVLICPPRQAAAVLTLYLALGAAGLPVFSGGRAGVATLVGPTGGYLIGFLIGATLGAAVRRPLPAHRPGVSDTLALTAMFAGVYVTGTTWLAYSTGMGATAAIAAGVAPFVLLDGVKAAVAVVLARRLRAAGLVDATA
jgi:biotin transport system substrate-specific component